MRRRGKDARGPGRGGAHTTRARLRENAVPFDVQRERALTGPIPRKATLMQSDRTATQVRARRLRATA